MTEPVTVLMPVGPNYNPDWLKEAFDSAVNQTYPPKEILIIDDGANLCDTDNNKLDYPFVPGQYLLQDVVPPVTQENIIKAVTKFENELGSGSVYRFSLPIVVASNDLYTYNSYPNVYTWYNRDKEILYRIWKLPTNVGFRAAFNLGVGLLEHELVVYLAADDKLMPTTIEKAVATWEANNRKDAWYPMPYIDSNGNVGSIANNLAMTTKHFFLDMCGGYPPAAFVGPDAALLSCLMVHAPDRIIPVKSDEPLYWIREHPDTETHTHTAKYAAEMTSIRGKLTEEFKLNE